MANPNDLLKQLGLVKEEQAPVMLQENLVPKQDVVSEPIQAPIVPVETSMSPKEAYIAANVVPAAKIQAPVGGDFSETEQERKDRLDREKALGEKLSKAKTDYESALQDASDREFKQNLWATAGNYLPGIIAGATAMNTKAAVKPADVPKIQVQDQQSKVDKRYKTDYENILAQYKQLASGNLTPKDRANLAARYNQMALLAQSIQGNLDQRADSRKNQEGEQFDKKVEALGKGTANNAAAYNALSSIDDILAGTIGGNKIDDLKVEGKTILGKDGKPVDLPGVSIPLLGRIGVDEKGRNLESAMATVFNTELKDRSGTAVTSPELERLKIEFGQGKFNTEAEMVRALQRYKQLASSALRNTEARYEKPIIEEYKQRGGVTSESFAPKNSAPSADSNTKVVNGVTYQRVNGGWQKVK